MPKVVHINCHMFYGTFVGGVYTKLLYRDAERCREICRYLLQGSFDVIILSEVWSDLMKRMFVDLLSKQFQYHWFSRKTSGCLTLGPEFLILTHEPYSVESGWHLVRLSDLSGWDKWSEKQVAGVKIGTTLVCCSHFDSSDQTCKARNVEQAVGFVTRYGLDASMPVIFAGDLNIQELNNVGSPDLCGEYVNLRDRFASVHLQDAHRVLYPDPVAMPFVTQDKDENQVFKHFDPAGTGKARIDYIFSRGLNVLQAGVDVKNELSDHYPVWAVFDRL